MTEESPPKLIAFSCSTGLKSLCLPICLIRISFIYGCCKSPGKNPSQALLSLLSFRKTESLGKCWFRAIFRVYSCFLLISPLKKALLILHYQGTY